MGMLPPTGSGGAAAAGWYRVPPTQMPQSVGHPGELGGGSSAYASQAATAAAVWGGVAAAADGQPSNLTVPAGEPATAAADDEQRRK